MSDFARSNWHPLLLPYETNWFELISKRLKMLSISSQPSMLSLSVNRFQVVVFEVVMPPSDMFWRMKFLPDYLSFEVLMVDEVFVKSSTAENESLYVCILAKSIKLDRCNNSELCAFLYEAISTHVSVTIFWGAQINVSCLNCKIYCFIVLKERLFLKHAVYVSRLAQILNLT